MPAAEAPMEQAKQASVHPPWDERRSLRDIWRSLGPSRDGARSDGGRVSARAIYLGIAVIVAGACLVDTFSVAHDMARRGPYNFWLPLLWEATSGAMIIALLPLPRHGARIVGNVGNQPIQTTLLLLALAV